MSTKVKFGDKVIQLPGTYSRIISGQTNPPVDLDYGKLLIVDNYKNGSETDLGCLGGAGINGELSSGLNSVYSFRDINSFKSFVGRGWWWKAAQYLFNPDGKSNGISEAIVVKPATTTAGIMRFKVSGMSVDSFLYIKTLDEGTGVNATEMDLYLAYSTLTISAAGTAGNIFSLKWDNEIVGTYTVVNLDTIQDVIDGLVLSLNTKNICTVKASNATTITINAPRGTGSYMNTKSLVVEKTGTVAGTITAFASGLTYPKLRFGYAYSIESGVLDSSKWVFKFWRGSFAGLSSDGLPYDKESKNSMPELIAKSSEVLYFHELLTWCNSDANFGSKFRVDTVNTVIGTESGEINSTDVLVVPRYSPAYGGTEVWDSIDDTLEVIKEIDYNYIITTSDIEDLYSDPTIVKLFDHIKNDAKFDKSMILGITSSNTISEPIAMAYHFDSEKVNLVYDSILERSNLTSSGFRTWSPFYHACLYAGRILGLAPWVPTTFKVMNVDGITTPLTERQKEMLDEAGVLCTVYDQDFKAFISLHDVNTLQDNDFVLTNSGTSHLISVERIKSQLNKELVINAKLDLLSDPNGVNRSSLTKTDAIEWTKGYLQRKLGTLIVEYRNVTATVQGDVIFIDYEAMPNSEIKGIFFTGRIYL